MTIRTNALSDDTCRPNLIFSPKICISNEITFAN